ncbi:MAG: NOG1 family protein [Candidatus Heimdallarchaeota archaeon]
MNSQNTQVGNPFAEIPTVPTAEIVNRVTMKAAMRASAGGTSSQVAAVIRARRTEARRMEIGGKTLRDRLDNVVVKFPNIDNLHPFYFETLDILFSVGQVKKTLGRIFGSSETIWRIRSQYVSKIWHSSTPRQAKMARQEGLARLFSVTKRLRSPLRFLEKVRSEMKQLPGIEPGLPTIVIAGYPNVGKSTLVKTVTDAHPEIASYPFTTREVMIGHTKVDFIPCQIIDTPGVLDRPISEKNPIEKRALAAIRHLAWVLAFLVDATETCGFPTRSQLQLLQELQTILDPIPVQLVYNKADILPLSNLSPDLLPSSGQETVQELIAHDRNSAIALLKRCLSLITIDRNRVLSIR